MSTKRSPTVTNETAVSFLHTTNLQELFIRLQLSLAVSTYQAQRLLLFSAGAEKLFMLMRVFERPTGMALSNTHQLALYAKNRIWIFHPAGTVTEDSGKILNYDLYLTPRRAHITGDIAGHELAWQGGSLIVVNTRFSCLARVDSPAWSFEPFWKPRFITSICPEDRCHLNGLAVDGTGPRYVTALGRTDLKEGWRSHRLTGGVVINVASGEPICDGLTMPHSPRLYAGKLWALNSGRGELITIDERSGKQTTVSRLPGYLRGLDFYENLAFIGCSKIREKDMFGGMPIEQQHPELECAVYVVDIKTGAQIGFIRFTKGIEELFDVKVFSQCRSPFLVGFEEDTVDGLFVVPPTK